ncbi:MAG: lysyl-tRNA synthetase, class [Solirubrobacteraceae bacterium]|nr:lysyl-tRNA synthetase, class [Solirubrobacteraceae bacterium]
MRRRKRDGEDGGDSGDEQLSELLAARRRKLESLREQGIDPFPHDFDGVTPTEEIRTTFADLKAGAETDVRVRVAGRLAARRTKGKAAFLDLVDRSGRMQLHARVDVMGREAYDRLLELDLGDLIGVDGTVFSSLRGELTVRVEDWFLLAKSLRPPPDKYHGLQDIETRYRRRELDLLANADTRELFINRARVVRSIRRFLDEQGFIELETPVLQPLYGGALARPFVTHHNALNRELYLRIAPELYLKRCIVGGLDRVYELGKDFRNEGLSPKHNPEFTMLEWYEAYADYNDVAERLEALIAHVANEIGYSGGIDFKPPWRRETVRDAILARTGVDIFVRDERDDLAAAMKERGLEAPDEHSWAQLVDLELISKHVEPTLIEPTFLLDYPVELSPFAKRHRSNDRLVERFEAFCSGVEFANAFSELNDPDEQRARFVAQQAEARAGDEEAQPFDESYIEALEYGMPPTGGIGVGIDRLVMVLTGSRSIREVVLFPTMRDQ